MNSTNETGQLMNVTSQLTTTVSQMNQTINTSLIETTEKPHPYLAISDALYVYLNPIIVIIGLINNMLTLVVMRRPGLKSSSASVYFSVLAISDSLVLLLDWMNNWIKRIFSIYIIGMSNGLCIAHRTLFSTSFTYSAWLVVCIVVERVVVVTFPFHAKRLCKPSIALATCFTVLILVLATKCYNIFMWEVDANGSCHFAPQHEYFAQYISQWLSSAFYSYIPFLILVILNCILIRNIARADKKRQEMSNNLQKGMTEKFIKTAVAICVSYLLFTTPLSIFYTLSFTQGLFNYESPEFALADSLIGLIGISNYAVNFYLYAVTSETFRNELWMLLCRKRFQDREETSRNLQSLSTLSSTQL